jgi:hypothetical protein
VEVSLAGIRQGGEDELASALQALAEAIVNSTELAADQKNEAVQMLDAIATEASKPKEARRRAVIRPVLSALGEVVKVGASLATIWGRVGAVITALSRKLAVWP